VPQKHCSDEQLLQSLDGELPLIDKAFVPWHLRGCWRCRARLDAIEAQVHALLREIDDHPFPQEELDAARNRFWLAASVADLDVGRNLPRLPVRFPTLRVILGIALSLSAFAWWHFAPVRPVPAAIARPKAALPPAIRIDSPLPVSSAPTVSVSIPMAVQPVVIPDEKSLPPVNPDDLEVHTLYALHQAQACLGGEIRLVVTDARHLEILGVVESDAKRDRIGALLSYLVPEGTVRLKVRTPAELPSVDLPPLSSALPLENGSAHARMLLEPGLIRAYGALYPDESEEALDKRVLALSNEVLRLATLALDHAWAIQNMATRYPAPRISGLPANVAGLIREMVRDHVLSLAGTCSDLSGRLTPLLDAMNITDKDPAEIQHSEAWQASAATLLRDVQQFHQDAHQLFSVTSEKIDDPAARAQRFRTALARISREVTADRMFERIFQ